MLLKEQTKIIQSDFARYCRTGEEPNLPGVTDGRIDYYRRLIRNIFHDSIESAYPITYQFLDEDLWEGLVDKFIKNHDCKSPQVWKLPFEFYKYHLSKKTSEKLNIPFLNDLLLFEWTEIEIYMMPDKESDKYSELGDFEFNKVIHNPEFKIIPLTYPVHMMGPEDAGKNPGAYFLLLFRHKDSGKVEFINLSPLFVFIIEQISSTEKLLKDIIRETGKLFNINKTKELQEKTLSMINDLRTRGFILGFDL